MNFVFFCQYLLIAVLALPFLAILLLGVGTLLHQPEKWVKEISRFTFVGILILSVALVACYLLSGESSIETHRLTLFRSEDYHFEALLFFDGVSSAFLSVIAIISNVIAFYCHRYLHRDKGYGRFFTVITLFVLGMELIILSGTLDLLFAGWELVGVSSYLLIGYYWQREQPVSHAYRAYMIYRLCDLGLLFGALFTHLLLHNLDLFTLSQASAIEAFKNIPLHYQWMMSALILIAASGKSAQFPFMTWLPRAMEGPTPSSAIFYGSLSIHAGLYLMIRMRPIWAATEGFAWVVGGIGLTTALLAQLFSRSQTNIKGQVAYAASAQVGVMLVELALGFETLAIIHFTGNAFLRCYQLLVAPSIVSEQLRVHAALEGRPSSLAWSPERLLPESLTSTLYVFSMNEGYIDSIAKRFIGDPLSKVAELCSGIFSGLLRFKRVESWVVVSLGAGLIALLTAKLAVIHELGWIYHALNASAVILSLAAFGEKKNPIRTLEYVVLAAVLIAAAPVSADLATMNEVVITFAGLFSSWFVIVIAYRRVTRFRDVQNFSRGLGLWSQFPRTGALFLIAVLCLIGLPLTSSFIGEDLIMHHTVKVTGFGAIVLSAVFVLNGLSSIRVFSRLFLGGGYKPASNIPADWSPLMAFAVAAVLIFIQLVPLTGHSAEWKPYGFIIGAFESSTRAADTYGNTNLGAPTMARPSTEADSGLARTSFQVAQSRIGVQVLVSPPLSGQLEFDFIDFGKATPTTKSFPRLRIAKINWKFSDTDTLIVGQDWDIFSPTRPFTFNYVGLYFHAGNSGFMRQQMTWRHDGGSYETALGAGMSGINNASADGDLEKGLWPLAEGSIAYKNENIKTGVSALGGRIRSASSGRNSTVYGLNLFSEWQAPFETKIHFDGYWGCNLASTGALTLASAAPSSDLREYGAYVSFIHPLSERFGLQGGVGFARVTDESGSPYDGISGLNVRDNLKGEAALSYSTDRQLTLFLQESLLRTNYTAGVSGSTYITELGAVLQI